MSDLINRLGSEAESIGNDLSNLPWWAHAIVAVLAFILFLLVAAAVIL